MKLDNGLYDSFRIMVRGGTSLEQLQEVLSSVYDGKVLIVEDTTISEINYNYVLETLQDMGHLSQLTKEQRDRAYDIVKTNYTAPDIVDAELVRIISDNWTDIVFGPTE